jgi:hypothetical protein
MTGLDEQPANDYRAAVRIRDHAEELNVYLASWRDEDESQADRRRQALTEAIGSLDLILRAVYDLRQSLVTQARQHDDTTDARADEILRRLREEDRP